MEQDNYRNQTSSFYNQITQLPQKTVHCFRHILQCFKMAYKSLDWQCCNTPGIHLELEATVFISQLSRQPFLDLRPLQDLGLVTCLYSDYLSHLKGKDCILKDAKIQN